jgi:hypothetical protein
VGREVDPGAQRGLHWGSADSTSTCHFHVYAGTKTQVCCPEASHPALDLEQLLAECGRLYLLGTSTGQRSMAPPLVTALVETIADTARRRAASSPGGRLYPPLGLFIDEAAQVAPLPSLPSLLADYGGQRIVIFVKLIGTATAVTRFPPVCCRLGSCANICSTPSTASPATRSRPTSAERAPSTWREGSIVPPAYSYCRSSR